jgi:hypothetical protein
MPGVMTPGIIMPPRVAALLVISPASPTERIILGAKEYSNLLLYACVEHTYRV